MALAERDVVIQTPRLRLGVPAQRDVARIVAYYRDNQEHLQPWSPLWPPGFLSTSFWRDQVARRQAEAASGQAYGMFIVCRGDVERIVGNLSLTQITRGASESCSLGYGLAAGAQGNGYMVEAVRAAVRFAFGDLRLHRVEASYMPRNRRSAKVLRSAGFQVEGYSRDYLRINGRWEDHVRAAITNDGGSVDGHD